MATNTPDVSARASGVNLEDLCAQLRVDILRCTAAAGSGHPTSSLSAVELAAVLIADHLRFSVEEPEHPGNDRFLLSKGHATPLLYSMLRAMGAIDVDELMTYREQGSRLEGHPTPMLPWVDAATGSLGQGLSIGVGVALAARLAGSPGRTFVLCGDSEMAEGSMWEAAGHAGDQALGNLVAIVDVNRLGQRGPTREEWNLEAFAERFRAFGWRAFEVDGHDLEAVDAVFTRATDGSDAPTVVIARTTKGKGVPEVEDRDGFHGKVLDGSDDAIAALGGPREHVITPAAPPDVDVHSFEAPGGQPVTWEVGDEVATRVAWGESIVGLGNHRGDVVVLDGEVSNSTMSDRFAAAHPDRYVEAYIAEQNMVGMAIGLASRGWRPFASSFAAFLSRAYDFSRMAPVSRVNLVLVGSHCGVSIGPDGPSQMGLEDIASMRAIAGSTVVYPCDANQTRALVDLLVDRSGVSYLRTTRGTTPVIYSADEPFELGGSRTLRVADEDQAVVVTAGITVHEAVAAVDDLEVPATVIDAYSIQPLDVPAITAAVERTGALVVVEDHRAAGGLGEAVARALLQQGVTCQFDHLAVDGIPGSATPEQQLRLAGIDRTAIANAVRQLVAPRD